MISVKEMGKSRDDHFISEVQIKPWCWGSILRSGEGSSPALLLDVKPQEVVQHALAIVPTKHVDGVLVGNHRVLGAASPDKLITCRHFFSIGGLSQMAQSQ